MDLKPCPFCGSDPEYVNPQIIYGPDLAYCHGCKAEVPVETWNRRAPQPEGVERCQLCKWWHELPPHIQQAYPSPTPQHYSSTKE